MLIRIVKMNFREEQTENFLKLFNDRKHLIASFDGCCGVELLKDISNPNTFFTYSKWQSKEQLDAYRNSELFNTVWSTVKKWFDAKPEAWSVKTVNS